MNFSSYSFISLVVQDIFNNQESYQFLKNKKENSTTIRSMVYWTTIPFKRSIPQDAYWTFPHLSGEAHLNTVGNYNPSSPRSQILCQLCSARPPPTYRII